MTSLNKSHAHTPSIIHSSLWQLSSYALISSFTHTTLSFSILMCGDNNTLWSFHQQKSFTQRLLASKNQSITFDTYRTNSQIIMTPYYSSETWNCSLGGEIRDQNKLACKLIIARTQYESLYTFEAQLIHNELVHITVINLYNYVLLAIACSSARVHIWFQVLFETR